MTQPVSPELVERFTQAMKARRPDAEPYPLELVYAHADAQGLPCDKEMAAFLSLFGLIGDAPWDSPMLELDDSVLERGIPGPHGEPRYLVQLAGLFMAARDTDGIVYLVDAFADVKGRHGFYLSGPGVRARIVAKDLAGALNFLLRRLEDPELLPEEKSGPALQRIHALRVLNLVGYLRGTALGAPPFDPEPPRAKEPPERFLELVVAARLGSALPWTRELSIPGVAPLYRSSAVAVRQLAEANLSGEPLDAELEWLDGRNPDLKLCAARRILRRAQATPDSMEKAHAALPTLMDEGMGGEVVALLEDLPLELGLDLLLQMLAHPDEDLAADALIVLRTKTGLELGADPAEWRAALIESRPAQGDGLLPSPDELTAPPPEEVDAEEVLPPGLQLAAKRVLAILLHQELIELVEDADRNELLRSIAEAIATSRTARHASGAVLALLFKAPQIDDIFGTDYRVKSAIKRALE